MSHWNGCRTFPRSPPRGTCSRIISLRLHRLSKVTPCIHSDSSSLCQTIYHSTRGIATSTLPFSAPQIRDEDLVLVRSLVDRFPSKNHTDYNNVDPGFANEGPEDIAYAQIEETSTDGLIKQFPIPFQKLLEALQNGDTRRLIIYLRKITKKKEEQKQLLDFLDTLPRTTITELFRSIDPLDVVSKYADPTSSVRISLSAYSMLDLGHYVDHHGIRRVYIQLLHCMLVIMTQMRTLRKPLLIGEYTSLLRCAGAASDTEGAKWIWREMERNHTTEWRQSHAYAEFMAARFLTRPFYVGFDKSKHAVIPRDLHRSRLKLRRELRDKLDRLRYHTRRKSLNFGLNKDVDYAEDLKRIMRKSRPQTRVYWKTRSATNTINEHMLCTAIIAFARAGVLRYVANRILDDFFGIRIKKWSYPGVVISNETGNIEARRFIIQPTPRLIDAVVQAFCSNAEIATALQVVNHISHRHKLPISHHIWQDVLEWAYVHSSKPISTGWKTAGMPSKIPDKSTIELIWAAMEKNGIERLFAQYLIFVRTLIMRKAFSRVTEHMRPLVVAYDKVCQEYEEAVFEYVRMIRDGVHVSEATHQYERLRIKKANCWLDISTTCRQFLMEVRSFSIANTLTTVEVPGFIEEFRTFIPNPAEYRTSTGYVSLFDPAKEFAKVKRARRYWIYITVRTKAKGWGFERTTGKITTLMSRRSLTGHLPVSRLGVEHLLTSLIRAKPFLTSGFEEAEKKESTTKEENSNDEDDFF
ncbi:hypothetical protein F4804DRAFT_340983 [Jackrogersella minutella]|nr:hypothetical protein F4804DRAFT_340983 [Jackrogersella minutella]